MPRSFVVPPALVLVAAACGSSPPPSSGPVAVRDLGAEPTTPAAPRPAVPDPAPLTPPPDPHVHAPVTSDGLDLDDELKPTMSAAPACKGVCNAPLPAGLQDALVAITRRTRHCAAVASMGGPPIVGTIKEYLRVGPSGEVCGSSVEEGTLHSQAIDGCVEKVFRDARGLPGTGSGCIDVAIPIRFSNGDQSE